MADGYVDSETFIAPFGDESIQYRVAIEKIDRNYSTVDVKVIFEKISDIIGGTSYNFDLLVDGMKVDSYGIDDVRYADEHTFNVDADGGSSIEVIFTESYGGNEVTLTGTVPIMDGEVLDVYHTPEDPTTEDVENEGIIINIEVKNTGGADQVLFDMETDSPGGPETFTDTYIGVAPGETRTVGLNTNIADMFFAVEEPLPKGDYEFCYGGKCTNFTISEPGPNMDNVYVKDIVPPSDPMEGEVFSFLVHISNDNVEDVTGVEVPFTVTHSELGESSFSKNVDLPGDKTGELTIYSDTDIASGLGTGTVEKGEVTLCVSELT